MDKKRICIVCVIMVFSIMTGYLFEKESKEEISMEPDVVSSISMNRDQYFTVVANRNRIEDKEEFAKLLVKMCRENSFHTIKFSTDRGYATEIHMQVYLCEEDIEDANVVNDDAEEEESVSVEKDNKDDEAQFATSSMVGGSICIVLALFIVYLFVKKKKKDKKVNMTVPIDPEESVTEKSPEEDEE